DVAQPRQLLGHAPAALGERGKNGEEIGWPAQQHRDDALRDAVGLAEGPVQFDDQRARPAFAQPQSSARRHRVAREAALFMRNTSSNDDRIPRSPRDSIESGPDARLNS